MQIKAKTIREYLIKLPPKHRKFIKELTDLIKKKAPNAVELISYGMPAYKINGRILVYCAAFKNHYSLFPGPKAISEFKEGLVNYETSKGTIKFSYEKPLPKGIISKIIIFKVKHNEIRANRLKI